MLHSTWCTSELVKAVEKDYILHKIHEVWHFPEAQRWTGLFADYVNTRLKIKKESAGWPSWCQTVDQKWEYILRYQEREGIRLDVKARTRTQSQSQVSAQQVPVLCSFFVLSFHPFSSLFFLLGVFWGKFGDRVNKPTTVMIKDPSHLFSLLSNAALDVSTLRLCTDDILEAMYTSVHDNAVKGTKTNISVAPFTTCPARLKLYMSL